MDKKNINGLIAVGITLGIAGIGYYFLVYKKKDGNNFEDLLINLGSTVKPNKDNIVSVKFNADKNLAQFYTNNRVVIFDNATKKVLNKGTYSDGGKTINMDDGKSANTNSVWGNLLEIIK